MKLATQPVAPGVVHAEDVDAIDRKLEMRALQLAVEHLALLRELLGVGKVLQLAAPAPGLEEQTRRLDARGRRVEHRGGRGPPEVLEPARDFGLDRLSRDGPFGEHDAT